MDDQARAAMIKGGAAIAGAALLGYAANECLRYATGQAIIAGAALPALTVALLAVLAGAVIARVAN